MEIPLWITLVFVSGIIACVWFALASVNASRKLLHLFEKKREQWWIPGTLHSSIREPELVTKAALAFLGRVVGFERRLFEIRGIKEVTESGEEYALITIVLRLKQPPKKKITKQRTFRVRTNPV